MGEIGDQVLKIVVGVSGWLGVKWLGVLSSVKGVSDFKGADGKFFKKKQN